MAIDARIPLMGQGPNTANALFQAVHSANQNKAAQQNQLLREQQLRGLTGQNEEAEKRRLDDSYINAALRTRAHLDNQDIEGLERYYVNRAEEIQARNGDPAETLQALHKLRQGDYQSLTQGADSVIQAAQQAGLIAMPQPAKDARTDDIKEYEQALQSGYQGSFMDYMRAIKGAGATNIQTNINTAQNEFFDKLGGGAAKNLLDRREKAQQGISSLAGIREARKLLDSGVITGTGADIRVALGKALNTIGVQFSQDAVANSEAFVAAQAKQVANIIQEFGAGTGLSDADREFAIKAAGGNINMTEESIRRILDINEKAIRNIVRNYNEDASKVPIGAVPFPLTIEMPELQNNQGERQGSKQGGVLMIDAKGNRAMVYPDGSYEEVQ